MKMEGVKQLMCQIKVISGLQEVSSKLMVIKQRRYCLVLQIVQVLKH